MNETIGAKGGHNDRKRVLRIKAAAVKQLQKQQEEAEIRRLEEDVKRKQRYVLIRSLPLFIAYGVVKSFSTSIPKKNLNKKRIRLIMGENNEKEVEISKNDTKEKEKVVVAVLPTTDEIHTEKKIKVDKNEKVELLFVKKKKKKKKKPQPEPTPVETTEVLEDHSSLEKEEVTPKIIEAVPVSPTEEVQPIINEDKIKLQNKLNEYEDKLKERRYELKRLLLEYNTLVQDANNQLISQDSILFFDKINKVLSKIDDLKRIIMYGDFEKEGYSILKELLATEKDAEKEDSFFVMIDQKVQELEDRISLLKGRIEERKNAYHLTEEQLALYAEKYYQFDKWNDYYEMFQLQQETLLKEMKEKVENAVTIQEKNRIQIQSIQEQSKKLMNLVSATMLLPGNRAAKAVTVATLSTLFFVKNLINPPITVEKYESIEVMDYRPEIEHNIESIEESKEMLKETSRQIDGALKQMKEQWKESIDLLPESKEIISNFEKLKDSMQEKEFEMQKMREQNQKELENNTNKLFSK